jgi:hypothetical protein
MERFVLDGGYKYNEDGDPTVVVADDGDTHYEWEADDVFGADWKDIDGIIEAVINAARDGGDVIQINDGSDAFWFANSMKAKLTFTE